MNLFTLMIGASAITDRADVLPSAKRVRWVWPGTVARGNIQTAVESKLQTAAVMTAGEPGDNRRLAGRVDGPSRETARCAFHLRDLPP